MAGGDIEDELVVGEREVLGKDTLPLKAVGGQGLVEETLLVHIVSQLWRHELHLLRTPTAGGQRFGGDLLWLRVGYIAAPIVYSTPIAAADDCVVHRLQALQSGRPLRAPGVGEDSFPDPVPFALESFSIEGGEHFGAQEAV